MKWVNKCRLKFCHYSFKWVGSLLLFFHFTFLFFFHFFSPDWPVCSRILLCWLKFRKINISINQWTTCTDMRILPTNVLDNGLPQMDLEPHEHRVVVIGFECGSRHAGFKFQRRSLLSLLHKYRTNGGKIWIYSFYSQLWTELAGQTEFSSLDR